MAMNKREIDKILKKTEISDLNLDIQENKVDYMKKRIENAVYLLSRLDAVQKLFVNETYTKCIMYFEDIDLLTNNICLRASARRIHKYKKLWELKIKDLVNRDLLENWKKNLDKQQKIELIYEVPHNNFMDYDGRIGAMKSVIDGLVVSGLLNDDSEKEVPIILAKQKKSKNKKNNLYIILTIEEDEERYYTKEAWSILTS